MQVGQQFLGSLLAGAQQPDAFKGFQQGRELAGSLALGQALTQEVPVKQAIGTMATYRPEEALQARMANEQFQAKMGAQTGTKAEIKQLEQLWKDASRGLNYAIRAYRSKDVKLYTAQRNRLAQLLKERRPEVWDIPDVDPKADKGDAPGEPRTLAELRAEALNVAKEALGGDFKNRAEALTALKSWEQDQGELGQANAVNASRASAIAENWIDNTAFSLKEQEETGYQRGQKAEEQFLTLEEKNKWMYEPYTALLAAPDDNARKLDALMTALRKESGAAIGADEFTNFMTIALTGQELKRFQDETTGLIPVLTGVASPQAREAYLKKIANKYLSVTDTQKILNKLRSKMSSKYIKMREDKAPKAKAAPKPAAPASSWKKVSDEELDALFGGN